MRDDVAPADFAAELDGVDGFGDCADLVELDQDGVGGLFLDAPADELGVGHKEIIADDPDLTAHVGCLLLEASPVPLIEPVLDGDDRKIGDPGAIDGQHLVGVEGDLLSDGT